MTATTDTRDANASHIHNIRRSIMAFLALYAHQHDDLDDAAVMGAIGAVLCQMLVMRGNEIDENVLYILRETYKLMEIEHAMREKEEASETH